MAERHLVNPRSIIKTFYLVSYSTNVGVIANVRLDKDFAGKMSVRPSDFLPKGTAFAKLKPELIDLVETIEIVVNLEKEP